ncbi:IS66 Orf2 like protein [Chelatococcus asaccharovorans]|uniref:IS66 Orf2 like protein n=1 Tax=Chelatococcus asaccharovorans TaxID=28210 RepID=A0A2V3U457_9HYPH|nr:IS66 family insertion sequence element accessory protein TnpB [Chelatococcus asaccharovorans]PXW57281.1 IS66 Orf2 like protein [Chelatococcus asaccharovorans]
MAADGTGVVLVAKRLEVGEFRWPKIEDGVLRLTAAQALFEGLDRRRVMSHTGGRCQSRKAESPRKPLANMIEGDIDFGVLADEYIIVSEGAPGKEVDDDLVKRLADLGRHPGVHHQAVGGDSLMHLVALGRGLTIIGETTTAALFPGVTFARPRTKSFRSAQFGRPATIMPLCVDLPKTRSEEKRWSSEVRKRLPEWVAGTAQPTIANALASEGLAAARP